MWKVDFRGARNKIEIRICYSDWGGGKNHSLHPGVEWGNNRS